MLLQVIFFLLFLHVIVLSVILHNSTWTTLTNSSRILHDFVFIFAICSLKVRLIVLFLSHLHQVISTALLAAKGFRVCHGSHRHPAFIEELGLSFLFILLCYLLLSKLLRSEVVLSRGITSTRFRLQGTLEPYL